MQSYKIYLLCNLLLLFFEKYFLAQVFLYGNKKNNYICKLLYGLILSYKNSYEKGIYFR